MADRTAKKKVGPGGGGDRAAGGHGHTWRIDGALQRAAHLILAHGAGAGMDSAFLASLAERLDAAGVTVHRFEFPYMAARREGTSRRPAPKAETLTGDYMQAIGEVRARIGCGARLYGGGKSMGGRIACLAAGEAGGVLDGVVVTGFPLIPPGKPNASRAGVLETVGLPALIVQGTRDPFGGREAFAGVALPPGVRVHWIEDGDHDLKPRRASGWSHGDAIADAAREIAAFCLGEDTVRCAGGERGPRAPMRRT